MTDKEKVLDIAMNLNRLGDWAASDYNRKRGRIGVFLDQTSEYAKAVNSKPLPDPLKKPLNRFLIEYPKLSKEGKEGPEDTQVWAEKMMTWGNILTHRASLLDKK